jgi:hypothetical protein
VVVLEMPTELLLGVPLCGIRRRNPRATDQALGPPVAVRVLEDMNSFRIRHECIVPDLGRRSECRSAVMGGFSSWRQLRRLDS